MAIANQFDVTELQLGKFILVWETSAPFTAIVNKWRPVVEDLKENMMIQQINIDGLREFKKALQKDMADKAFKVRNAVQTFAMAQDPQDIILYNKVNIQESRLLRGSEELCVQRARIIETTGRELISELGPYALVIADVDSYLASIDTFEVSIPTVKEGIIAKKLATAAIKADIKKGRTIIRMQMKKGCAQFKDTAPQFFNMLMASFQVNNAGTFRTEMDFMILEKTSLTPLPGTKVTAVAVKDSAKVVNQYADIAGEADLQISPELYFVTFEIPEYKSAEMTLEAKRGKKLKVQVELEKVPI
ncbi:MAG: hypothetical protein ABIT08_10025 [Bacteroidia bacterium]